MTRIAVRSCSPVDTEILTRAGIHPVLARLFASRGVTSPRDIETAFAALRQQRAQALIIGSGAFMNSNRQQVVALAARQALPAIYPQRDPSSKAA